MQAKAAKPKEKKEPAPKKEGQLAKKPAKAPRFQRITRYFKEVKAEVQKVIWPSRRAALNLTGIVLAVTVTMSLALGVIDWIFSRIFAFFLR